jgi:hypothetical protein
VEHFEVLYGGRTTKVEEILANAEVAGAITLSLADVREVVLDSDASTELFTPARTLDVLA